MTLKSKQNGLWLKSILLNYEDTISEIIKQYFEPHITYCLYFMNKTLEPGIKLTF